MSPFGGKVAEDNGMLTAEFSPVLLTASKMPGSQTSLVAVWLRLHASNAGDLGSIPDWGTKISHATQCSQKKKNYFLR